MDENKQGLENQEEIEEVAGKEESAAKEPSPAPEQNTAQEQKPAQKKASVFKGNKFRRGGMATVLTVVFIAVVVVLNLLASLLTERFPSMNIDLTAQKMNTLSDQAVEIAQGVEQDTNI